MLILGCDPGHEKCGLAILQEDGTVIEKCIVLRSKLIEIITVLMKKYNPDRLLIGNGTTGYGVVTELERRGFCPMMVDERGTSLEAQDLWDTYRGACGWSRFLPRFIRLLFVPSCLDDWAAVALVRRWLHERSAPLHLQKIQSMRRYES